MFLSCIQSHMSWHTSEILIDPPSEQCYNCFTKMWRGCGTALEVRKKSSETLIIDSLSCGTLWGQSSCMTAGMNKLGGIIRGQADLETTHNSDLFWAVNNVRPLALSASVSLAMAGHAGLLAASEVIKL